MTSIRRKKVACVPGEVAQRLPFERAKIRGTGARIRAEEMGHWAGLMSEEGIEARSPRTRAITRRARLLVAALQEET